MSATTGPAIVTPSTPPRPLPRPSPRPWHDVLRHRVRQVFGLDPRSLALFRVALGALLLFDLILRSRDMTVFYTDRGVLPREHWAELTHRWHLSLHAASGELWWQALLFTIAGVAAIALMVGYRTRLATLVSLLLLGSLMNRNMLVLQGGDQLLVVMCFWAVFLPTGMRWSVDAALAPALRVDPNADRGPPAPGGPSDSLVEGPSGKVTDGVSGDGLRFGNGPREPEPWFGVASVAVILQVLYLYFFTALLKTGAAWRHDLDAAFHALSLQQFVTPIGEWMTGFPLLLKGATVYVLAVEFVAPFLVLSAVLYIGRSRFERLFAITRLTGLALLASLHVAFLLMLHIGLFPLIDLMSLSLLLPGAAWAWLSRVSARSTPTLYHRDGDERALKSCLLVREFLLPRDTPIRAASEADAAPGARAAWFKVARDGTLSEPRVPGTAFVTDRLAWRSQRWRPTLVGSLLAGFFFYVVTAYNVWELPGLRGQMPEHVERPARWLRIDQRWDMFAPYPLTSSVYPLVSGLLRSGEIVDLHRRTSSAADWAVPGRFYPLYDNYRWRKYLGRVDGHRSNVVRRAYGEYQCRTWNTPSREFERQLGVVEVNFVKLRTTTDGTPKLESRRLAWRHWCYPEFKGRQIDAAIKVLPASE